MTPATVAPRSGPLEGLSLLPWQVDAFTTWALKGSRGIVEAVTGTGKTRLAIAAARACLANGGQVLVLVPTLELQQQWVRQLREHVPGVPVGRLGGGHDDDLHERPVVVATPHSAAKLPIEPRGLGLLVADEAHRYGAPTWGGALKERFQMRLALTATYERNDDGIEDVLGPYFGGVVFRYGYDSAVPDGVVAPFRIAFVGTALEGEEQRAYDRLDKQVKTLHAMLIGDHEFPKDPAKLFPALAKHMATHERAKDTKSVAVRQYLSAVRGRRDVAANAAGKLQIATMIAPLLRAHADRALVFCDTVDQAELAARALSRRGVSAETVHGQLDTKKRRIRLAQFKNGNLSAVVAPRVLDEGIDVPEADVGLVLAAFQSRRQMIQRLGRILRRKEAGHPARLVVAYAKGTREDPAEGGHRDFRREIADVAEAVVTLDADAADADAQLGRFLST